MDPQKSKGRLLLVVIFAMTALPFSIAWLQGGKTTLIRGKTNKGQLINPVVATKRDDLLGLDTFSANNIGELQGHWLMVNIIPHDDCNFHCLEAIHKTRQLLLMMNKDLTRIRRVVVFFHETSPATAEQWLGDDKVLLKVKPSNDFISKINNILNGKINDGQLFLMDPMGNLMMYYELGFDPYKVKSDLMHLLRISQIG